jgi:hypothetical protein
MDISRTSSTHSQRRDDQLGTQPTAPLHLGSEARPGGGLEAIEPRAIDTLPVATDADGRDAVLPTYTPAADPTATDVLSGASSVVDSVSGLALLSTRRPKRTRNYGKKFPGGGQPVGQPYVPADAPFGPPATPTFNPYNPANTNNYTPPSYTPTLLEELLPGVNAFVDSQGKKYLQNQGDTTYSFTFWVVG